MKKPAPPPLLPPTLTISVNRCPYCHDHVLVDRGGWLACARCLGRHHAACWRESRTCGSCGHDVCLQQAPRSRGARPTRNRLVGALAFVLFVAGGIIAALSDGPAQAPPPESVAASVPGPHVTLGAEFSDAFGATGAKIGKVLVGGPANSAGLVSGAIIQSIDGTPIFDASRLHRALAECEPGDTVQLGIRPAPERLYRSEGDVDVLLVATVPESLDSEPESRAAIFHTLGVRVTTMTYGGVFVQEALAGTPAAPMVAEHDWIESVDGRPITNTRQLGRLLSTSQPGDTLRLGLRHPYGEGSIVTVTLPR